MFKIFEKNNKVLDMAIYWDKDVDACDLVEDLTAIGGFVCMSYGTKGIGGIMSVKREWINETEYVAAEIMIDEKNGKNIEKAQIGKLFKAVKFVKTII